MLSKLFLTLTLFCFSTGMYAQSDVGILDKILYAYQDDMVEYTTQIYYYSNPNTITAIDSTVIEMAQYQDEYLMQVEHIDILRTTDYSLQIDHEHKEIMVVQTAKNSSTMGIKHLQETIEMMKMELHQELKSKQEGVLVFSSSEHEKSTITIKYNPETYFLKSTTIIVETEETELTGRTYARVEAVYSGHKISSKKFPYSYENYVQARNGTFVARKKYEAYKVLVN